MGKKFNKKAKKINNKNIISNVNQNKFGKKKYNTPKDIIFYESNTDNSDTIFNNEIELLSKLNITNYNYPRIELNYSSYDFYEFNDVNDVNDYDVKLNQTCRFCTKIDCICWDNNFLDEFHN